ncbi:P-loop NTPase family protein, partial [Actinomadura kijaniata]|uniref:ATP-binding cassette domain-containing protein n=1 Tax=Actinomadura kijaniata TaxID=46161 RepID=UPI0031CEFD17
PALAATAPAPWALPAAFTVALAAATVTAAGLDTAILGPAPAALRPALAGLTAGAAVLAGSAATGVLALLGRVADDASALTLTAVPLAAAALPGLRLPEPGPTAEPAPASPPLLEVSGLSAGGGPAAVRDVSLQVRAGEAVAVFGPGARTLLSAVAGHLPPDRGAVVVGGTDVTAVPPGLRADLGLSHLVGAGTRDGRSVTELLRDRAAARGRADPGTAAAAVLEVFPSLRDRAHEPAADLDEPRARLLGLAEALITGPRLLLVDGLSPGLDRVSADVLAATVRRLLAEGTALLLAEPVIPVALSVCDRVHVLRRGRTAAELTAPTPEQVHHLLHRGGRPA